MSKTQVTILFVLLAVGVDIWLIYWVRKRNLHIQKSDDQAVTFLGAYSPVLTWIKKLWPGGKKTNLDVTSGSVSHPEISMDIPNVALVETEEVTRKNQQEEGGLVIPSTGGGTTSLFKSMLMITGVLLIIAALWYQQEFGLMNTGWVSWVAIVSGLLLFLLGKLIIDKKRFPDWFVRSFSCVKTTLGIQDWQIACLISSPFVAIIASLAAGSNARMIAPWLAVSAWLVGIGLVILGGWKPLIEKPMITRRVMLTCLSLIIVAFIIRGVNTTHIPIVLSGDEASSGLSAVEFIKGNTNNIFTIGWFSFPSLFYFVQSLTIRLLGQTIPALRLLAALVGALAVGATYLMARMMFGELVGIGAGIFLAAFNFHNNFSRIGLNNIWDGLWYVLVLGAIWFGWRSQQRLYFLLAGLCMGLAQYFYVTSRALPILVLIWFILIGLLDRTRAKRLWIDLLLTYWIGFVTYIPLGLFFLKYPAEFLAPFTRVSIFGAWMVNEISNTGHQPWQIILNQVVLGFQGFSHIPIKFWYQPGTPLLRPISGAFFYVGILLLILRLHNDRTLLLVLWIVSISLQSSLSESTPASQRLIAVTPAVAIVVAYGVIEFFTQMGRLWSQQSRWLTSSGLALILLISLNDLRFYFLEYTPNSNFGGDNTLIANDLADYLQGRDSKWQVLFFGYPRMGYYSIMSTVYLAPHIKGLDMNFPWGSKENPEPASKNLILVFLLDHAPDLEAAREDLPNGTLYERYNRKGKLLYWIYEVSPGDSL